MFLNPVINGYIPYTALKDGNMTIYDIFILNELILYKNDYDNLSRKEFERRGKK
jgi:hypothetical protein